MVKGFSKFSKLMILLVVLSLLLVGCKAKEVNQGNLDTPNDGQEVVEGNKDEIVDENTGLVFEKEMDVKYAEYFSVDYYKDGYKIITDSSDRKVLIVPEGKEVPKMKEAITVLQQPIEKIGLYSTVDASWFRPIGELDKISTVNFEESSWRIEEIVERMQASKIQYVGKTSSLDYELLESIDNDVNLLSKSSQDEIFPKFDELELNFISMGAYMEDDPRGRLEWVKFAAALLNKEEEANTFFDGELARIDEIGKVVEASTAEKPKVTLAYFSPSKSVFQVTNFKGHQNRTVEMAGGLPHPSDIGTDKRGSTAMTNEEFYTAMLDTDIIIYDNITGHGIQSMEELLASADYLADVDAVKEGRVWMLKRDFWQAGDKVADMTEDLHKILSTPHGEIEETDYYYLMK